MSKYSIDSTTITAIANAIRTKDGTSAPILVSDFAPRILAIPTTGSSAATLPSNVYYPFAGPLLKAYVDNGVVDPDQIDMTQVATANGTLFKYCLLDTMPAGWANIGNGRNVYGVSFEEANWLKTIPEVTGGAKIRISEGASFKNAYRLWYIDPNTDWSVVSTGGVNYTNLFYYCYCLKAIPQALLTETFGRSYHTYNTNAISLCHNLRNLVLPTYYYDGNNYNINMVKYGSNNTIQYLTRLSSLTFSNFGNTLIFDTRTAGSYGAVSIHLDTCIGYALSGMISNDPTLVDDEGQIWDSNLRVTDSASYQTLKNNPRYWTTSAAYSHYNHDSAVETINSLPDLISLNYNYSATISFKGASGSSTDAGAINTMTAAEIAVATNKGWTITFN